MKQRIKCVKDDIDFLHGSSGMNEDEKKRALDLNNELRNLYQMEELFWMQRSRINWLQAGDRNTTFFFFILLLQLGDTETKLSKFKMRVGIG